MFNSQKKIVSRLCDVAMLIANNTWTLSKTKYNFKIILQYKSHYVNTLLM
jgi:hypothetical protein